MKIRVSRVWVINLLLAFFSFIFFCIGLTILFKSPGKYNPPEAIAEKYDAIFNILPAKRSINTALYDGITSNNALSPDRKYTPYEEVKKEPEKKEEIQELPDKELVLYGTLISGDFSYAIISNPGVDGNDKPQLKRKKGESVGNYIIKEIKALSITVNKNGQEFEISLNKSKYPGDGIKTSLNNSLASQEKKSLIKRIGSISTGSDENGIKSNKNSGKKSNEVSNEKFMATDSMKVDATKHDIPSKSLGNVAEKSGKTDGTKLSTDAGEEKFEIIDTPFGQIKRKVK